MLSTILCIVAVFITAYTIIIQCASTDRKPPPRHPKSARSRKSSRSAKSRRSGKSRRSSKSRKSRRSSKSRSRKSRSRSRSRKSGKRTTSDSQKSVNAHLMADKCATSAAMKAIDKEQNAPNVSYANIRIVPHECVFKPIGGLQEVRVRNSTQTSIVFMIKCSDNLLYSINPVYGQIPVNGEETIHILRENGGIKHDKIIFLSAEAKDSTPPKEVFQRIYDSNSPNYNVNVLPLLTAPN